MEESKSDGIKDLLNERGSRYGAFSDNAYTAQQLKKILRRGRNWYALKPHQAEALEMIMHKAARIINGDADYADSWRDIQGYAKLGETVSMGE